MPSATHRPTAATVRGEGELVRSRVGSNLFSSSGRNRMKPTISAGMLPEPSAHAHQSSRLGWSSTMVAQRDLTGSRIEFTPARCEVSLVAPQKTT